ncbi:MAG: hypothetical protein AAGF01_27150 [Cyanobacteria bacterium P01_G01_bin.38]
MSSSSNRDKTIEVQQLASTILKRRFITTITDINRFYSECRDLGLNPWASQGKFAKTYLGLEADKNLQLAHQTSIEKAVTRLQKQIAQAQRNVCRRARQGRTRGAGAGALTVT